MFYIFFRNTLCYWQRRICFETCRWMVDVWPVLMGLSLCVEQYIVTNPCFVWRHLLVKLIKTFFACTWTVVVVDCLNWQWKGAEFWKRVTGYWDPVFVTHYSIGCTACAEYWRVQEGCLFMSRDIQHMQNSVSLFIHKTVLIKTMTTPHKTSIPSNVLYHT